MRFWNLNGNNGISGFFVSKILPLRLAPAKSRMYGDAHISVHVMKMFSGDPSVHPSSPPVPRFCGILMASELTNCVIDIPSNIRARKTLIFRDPVTNVTEEEATRLSLIRESAHTHAPYFARQVKFTVIYLCTSCI